MLLAILNITNTQQTSVNQSIEQSLISIRLSRHDKMQTNKLRNKHDKKNRM